MEINENSSTWKSMKSMESIVREGGGEASNRIKHIHFKDLRSNIFNKINFDETSFLNAVLEGVFTVPGDGCIDFNSISKVKFAFDFTEKHIIGLMFLNAVLKLLKLLFN